jgi:hypothetical protein
MQEMTVRVATQDDLVKYLAQGQSVETAISPEQTKLDLDNGN